MFYSTVYMPGNGTRYAIVWGIVPGGEPFVALPDFGKAATMTPYPAEAGYISEKLGISVQDAEHVFDAIRAAAKKDEDARLVESKIASTQRHPSRTGRTL